MNELQFYIKKFSRLRTAKIKGKAAPHKPVLLLAIIHEYENGRIDGNAICISSELVGSFHDYWHQLVHESIFTPNFSLPFYHLKSEGFWHLTTLLGRELLLTSSHSIRSFGHLKEVVDHASFDLSLHLIMKEPDKREVLKEILLQTYFPYHQELIPDQLIKQIADEILQENPVNYRTKASNFDEEEVFIRSGVFKKEIPRIYNYACCISELRIMTSQSVQMIDACHIVPFSISHDDTISNGIPLCPNLHRAFDRGLIAIDDQYRVMVKSFVEEQNSYSIHQFEGKQILLPAYNNYYPLKENLEYHRKRFGFGDLD